MAKVNHKTKKKFSKRKRLIPGLIVLLFIIIGSVFFYISTNFNQILTDKINSLYVQSEASKYYSLDFDKLRVNLINMNIRVYNVHFTPKTNEHHDFFAKNGSIELEIEKVVISKASVLEFISSNSISMEEYVVKKAKISIHKPATIFQPFAFIQKESKNDSLQLKIDIQNIKIKQAELLYYTTNGQLAENSFDNFNLEIDKLILDDESNSFKFSFDKLSASLNNIQYRTQNGAFISLDKYAVDVTKFDTQIINNTFDFHFTDFQLTMVQPKFITADSVYTISFGRILIDKSNKKINLSSIQVHPNLDKKEFAHNYKFQKLRPDLQIDNIYITEIDFERLFENKGIYADSINISGVKAYLFKSKKQPLDKQRVPNYLAKQILAIKYPLKIKVVKATDVDIDFSMLQEDGRISHITINKISGKLLNIQNKSSKQKLRLFAKGRVENSIPFSVNLVFNYAHDHFTYQGQVYKSNLKSLSSAVRSFAPIEIKSGLINNMKYQGVINRTDSRGTMTFLYKKLNIQLQNKKTKKKKAIKNHFLSFAANTYLLSNNPANPNVPARKVSFFAPRDMNKGFIHILVQSVLSGIKETVDPGRENRHHYKEVKKHKKAQRK